MKSLARTILLILFAGCSDQNLNQPSDPHAASNTENPAAGVRLMDARRGFQTRLLRQNRAGTPIAAPPSGIARVVKYDAPLGQMSAYLTLPPRGTQQNPAIIWISGGDCNTVDDGFFRDAPADNDQTAGAFRKAGVVTMYPSLRGGNDNPGVNECFLGEVDDVLAAADFLSKEATVDPDRIYLGGHSTGATLVLLVAASTDRFRGVFAFGPASNVAGYGDDFLPFDTSNEREIQLRSPENWTHSIQCPTFIFEGVEEPGNFDSLQAISRRSRNPLVRCLPIKAGNHFSILAPTTAFVAEKILQDTHEPTNISFSKTELDGLLLQ